MAKRCLITGASGFTGLHLVDLCLERGLDVYGVSRGKQPACSRMAWIEAELSDPSQVHNLLALAKPDVIFHLAGVSKASNWADYLKGNVRVAATLLTMTATMFPAAKVLLVGSCAQYGGQSVAGPPILEDYPLQPETAYGLSKCLQEEVGEQHVKNGLKVYLARPFNLIGPGQTGDFVAVSLMSKIRAAANTGKESVHVGDLNSGRDFLDVRDCVRAYWDLLEKGEVGTPYNVCSGRCMTVRELYHAISKVLGVFPPLKELIDADTDRNASAFRIYGDAGKLQKRTGWHPSISLHQSLRDMLLAKNQNREQQSRHSLTPQQP